MRQRTYITLLFAFIFVLDSCKKGAPILKTNSQDNTPVNGSTKAALQGTVYTFTKIFNVPSTENQQGLAFGGGSHFVTFDIGSGQARIVQYNSSGAELKRTPGLPMGHGAEVSYSQANGNLYIANGGLSGSPTYVYEVNMRLDPPVIVRTIDFSSLGFNGMVAVDNGNGRLVVFTGPNGGPYTVSTVDFDGTILSQFSIAEPLGTPQGIEMIGNEILYYTSQKTDNNIAIYSAAGRKLYSIPVPIANEGEGLSIDEATRTVYVGTHGPNTVYKMSPAFVSDALLGMNLVINPNAEGGRGGDASVSVPIPFWTTTGTTVIRYGTGSFPSLTSPGSPDRRTNFFAGGAVATGKLKQRVNVSNLSADIDAAALWYSLKGWLGGYSSQNDNAKVTATFLSSSNTSLGTATIGPVMAVDRSNVTGMVQRSKTGVVPPSTRSILMVVTITRLAGTNCDGYADDLSLVLTKP